MSTTTTSHQTIERIARQHAEAALCHLAHVAGITFGDVAFDRDRDELADEIASYLSEVERRARGEVASPLVELATDELEVIVASFGRVDRSTVSGVVQDDDDRYGVLVGLYRVGSSSRAKHWSFECWRDASAFRNAAHEIVARAT